MTNLDQNSATIDAPHFSEGWLSCRLDSGMFSDEVAVTYPATGEWQKSVFVPSEHVRNFALNATGEVRVRLFERDGKRFAVLPTSYRDLVLIDAADLRS